MNPYYQYTLLAYTDADLSFQTGRYWHNQGWVILGELDLSRVETWEYLYSCWGISSRFSLEVPIEKNYGDVIRYLVEKKVPIRERDVESALLIGHEWVRYLVERGVEWDGETEVLLNAVRLNDFDSVKLLVEQALDSVYDFAALEEAVEQEKLEMVQYLVGEMVDPEHSVKIQDAANAGAFAQVRQLLSSRCALDGLCARPCRE